MWKVPPIWAGETAVIIGGGPSVTREQVESAKRFKTIGTNMAFVMDPTCDFLCWGDSYWYIENWRGLSQHKGEKVTWRHCPKFHGVPDFHQLTHRQYGRDEKLVISRNPCVVHGTNTGQGAINIAYLLGATRVLLLGFDMTSKAGHNWHSFHKRHANEERYAVYRREIETSAVELRELGIEVINCSPTSVLTCFDKARIEEIK